MQFSILQVIDNLAIGGAEKILINLSNLQKKRGHEVCVLSILGEGQLENQLLPGISKVYLHRQWKFNPITMYHFIQIAIKYEVIHVHSSHNLRYVFLATKLFGLKKVIFFHEHNGNIEVDQAVKWYHRLIYPRVHFIGVSKKINQWAVEKVKVPLNKVHLLPNFVKLFPFQPPANNKAHKNNASIILTSNFLRNKNLEFAINLLPLLTKCSLTIIGQPYDLLYLEELIQQSVKLGINDRIKFIHNCMDIQPILNQFDLAIHTSKFESGPLVLIEYLAQGIPFLSYRTGEIAHTVEDQFSNFIIDNFQPEQWIKRIQLLLSKDRQSLGLEMRSFYEAQFSEDNYYEQCQQIYKKGLLS